jgi:hypothetical protein
MSLNLYQIRLREFERKNHTILKSIHAELLNEWNNYKTQYNYRVDINYENFVKYCYSTSKFSLNRDWN